jgi:hypothetical protein
MGTVPASQHQSGLTSQEQNLLIGQALMLRVSALRLAHWEVLAVRSGMAILATAVLTLLGFMAWRLHRILTIYDQETTYRRISTDWLIRHGMPDRRNE